METKERKPGYFARLKRRRELKQNQSEKSATEQNQSEKSATEQNQSEKSATQRKESDSPLKTHIVCGSDGMAPPSNQTSSEPEQDVQNLQDLQETKPQTPHGSEQQSSQAKRDKTRPAGTTDYTVGGQDSLNSIALRFNITPNKLVQLNRLYTRSVYPGQKLFVPHVGQSGADSESHGDPATTNGQPEKGSHEGGSGVSSGPAHRGLSPPPEDEGPATRRFIKMSCKYFTDGMGVVGGVMIVTPNNIMFDPHKSDPLVLELGCEEYGLICPMSEVLSVALYHDLSRMELHDQLPPPSEWAELPSDRDLDPFSRYEALAPGRPLRLDDSAISDTMSEGEEHGRTEEEEHVGTEEEKLTGTEEDKLAGTEQEKLAGTEKEEHARTEEEESPSDEGFTEPVNADTPQTGAEPSQQGAVSASRSFPDALPAAGPCRTREEEEEDEGLAHNSSVEDSAESWHVSPEAAEQGSQQGEPEGRSIADSIDSTVERSRKLSLRETARASGKRSPQDALCAGEPSEEERRRSYEEEVKTWLLQRMHAPIKDLLSSSETESKTPPMFLCFKVGKPMRKSFAIGRTSSSPTHSTKQPEYWFAVPQERVDHLYSFLLQWSPEAYGKEALPLETDHALNMVDNFFSDPARSWEIVTINEAKRRRSFGSCEGEEPGEGEPADQLPILSHPSALLQDTHVQKLACVLPARVQGYPWSLVYSTARHGTSLKTLYRSLAALDGPVLLVLRDMDGQVFGAFSTHPFRVSEHCYGTGETFLYRFCPNLQTFRWTGNNSYFVKGNVDSLQLGGGGGQLGLWLDADLYHGTSSTCGTFNNPPLCSQTNSENPPLSSQTPSEDPSLSSQKTSENPPLSTQIDFIVHSLEIWAFE